MKDLLKDILYKYWGYKSFRPNQQEIIESVYQGKDTMALLPTGGGKSLCYQIPGIAKDGMCIVVTPLIALMKDQVENLRQKGVNATAIYSGMGKGEIDRKLEDCTKGYYEFLYLSPERLQTDLFRERLTRFNVNLLAVDEAHCISEWGFDFRPAYLKIAEIREIIPTAPVLAVTATAPARVQEDISDKLKLRKPAFFKNSFDRENLIFGVAQAENKEQKLTAVLKNIPGTGIVYLRSRAGTEKLAKFLKSKGFNADYYHAGLSGSDREKKQVLWQKDKLKIMIATNAFGMGIDKPDVRKVIHMSLPDSLEAYYQEAGRAGRDQKKAYAVIITHASEKQQLLQNIDWKFPPAKDIKDTYHALGNYLQLPVGSGFGESFDFDIKHFSDRYNLKPIITSNALSILEQEGYLSLSHNAGLPARMLILINYRSLYEFQIENKSFEPLIKIILRTYSGLFEEYTSISENEIASKAGITVNETIETLKKLKQLKIIDYQPAKDKPQVFFLTNRLDKSQLTIDNKRLSHRKAIYKEKVDAFLEYCFAENCCRNKIILRYFGEKAEKDCGHCDYCIKSKKDKDYDRLKSEVKEAVMSKLASRAIRFESLLMELQHELKNEISILNILRELIDEGVLIQEKNGLVKRR